MFRSAVRGVARARARRTHGSRVARHHPRQTRARRRDDAHVRGTRVRTVAARGGGGEGETRARGEARGETTREPREPRERERAKPAAKRERHANPANAKPAATRAATRAASDVSAANSPYRSAAERARELETRALHARSRRDDFTQSRRTTTPRSPAISKPATRLGGARAKTTEELELEAIAAAPKFKARAIRGAVLRGAAGAAEKAAAAGAARRAAARKAATAKPTPFGLGRARDANHTDEDDAKRDAKRARKLGDAAPPPPTMPVSPRFATTKRAILRAPYPPIVAAEDASASASASASAYARHPARHRVDGVTQPAPFDLTTERRGAYAKRQLERMKAEEAARAAEARRVSARPAPSLTTRPRRASQIAFKPPTAPEPFRLRGVALREYETRREATRRADEEAAAKAAAEFKARRVPFTTFNPLFRVEPSSAPLTEPEEACAAGRRRAEERAAFDARVTEEMAAKEAEEEAAARAKEAEERRLTREYRKSISFKAAPVPNYAELAAVGVAGNVEERQLTVPESPALATRRRSARWG